MKIFGVEVTLKQIFSATSVQRKGIWRAHRRIRKDQKLRSSLDRCASEITGWLPPQQKPASDHYFFILTGLSTRGRRELLAGHPEISKSQRISSELINVQMQRFVNGYVSGTKPTQVEFWQQLVYNEYIRERALNFWFGNGYNAVDYSDNLTAEDQERRAKWAKAHDYKIKVVWIQGEEHLAPEFKRKKFEQPMVNRPEFWQILTYQVGSNPAALQIEKPQAKPFRKPKTLVVEA